MRILHIDTGLRMRGGQWQVLHLLQGLAERGIPSRLLSPATSDLFQAAASVGLDVRPLRLLAAFGEARAFALLHAHDARAHSLAAFLGKPFVVSRRVAFPVQRTPWSQWKYARATHYLAVSNFVKDCLVSAGIHPARVSVVYDGVRLPDRAPDIRRAMVVALDSDDPGKGKAIVEQAARLASIPVYFSKQLLRDLPQASVFVYVTSAEGLGSAALLAMAHGAPVIASSVGGLPEIVNDGETGLLLANNAPQSVATAMGRMLYEPALAGRLAARARKQVERHFTIEHMVEQTVRAYEKVLAC